MLLNANRHLKDGGIFVLDYWFAPALHHLIPSTRVKRITNQTLDLTRLAEPEYSPHSNCVKVNYLTYAEDLRSGKIQKIEECHELRAFLIEEIEQLAKIFAIILIFGIIISWASTYFAVRRYLNMKENELYK